VEDVREILKATARATGVTKQLLAFSRRQTLETEVLDLRGVVTDTGRMLRALLPATIELVLPDARGREVLVRAARAQVEQIIMNLAVNARDAMPSGGRLVLALATRPDGTREEAVLTVSDSGSGMTEEVRTRAFEPFFTTKPKGQGTGLGLATVYGLVRQFGGRVELESARGAGTTFTVVLPVARDTNTPHAASASVAPVAARGARLLVAEDEPQLRAVMSRALERAGYEVITASDGAAALMAIHGGGEIDLLLSDVAMPRLGGRELALAVEAGWSHLPIVLMSGYAEHGAAPEGAGELPPNVVAFVEKPFEMERLLQIVGEVLAGR
jgi:CheY-like chemotaxis protein